MAKQLDASSIYELGINLGYFEGILTSDKLIWRTVREALQNLGSFKSIEGLEFVGIDSQAELSRLARTYKYSYSRLFADNDKAPLKSLIHNWYGRLTEVQKRWIMKSPRTHLDISKLSAGAHTFFEDDEWSSKSEILIITAY